VESATGALLKGPGVGGGAGRAACACRLPGLCCRRAAAVSATLASSPDGCQLEKLLQENLMKFNAFN